MKKNLHLSIAFMGLLQLFFMQGATAQYTAIPDANFEQKLIDLGIDSVGTLDGQILTADAQAVTSLDVSNSSISDLTGIADFDNVVTLQVQGNTLTTLDVTSNPALTWLNCYDNNLTSLNTTGVTTLKSIECYNNSLTALDVTTNTALENLVFSNNSLTSIDLSNNTALQILVCASNDLLSLDLTNNTALTKVLALTNNLGYNDPNSFKIKNGNNTNIPTANFDIRYNWNTMCVEVDDVAWSNTNWTNKEVHHTYSTNCSALPVELVDFKASYRDGKAYIDWTTASEVNNRGFEIEVSTDGSRWREIGFVKGNGNTTQLNHYTAVDVNPKSGMNYYRLVQVDFDGSYKMSKVVSIRIGEQKRVGIAPNPVKNRLLITPVVEQPVRVKIFDALGSVVYQGSYQSPELDVSSLTNGSYLLVLESTNGNVETIRFIKE